MKRTVKQLADWLQVTTYQQPTVEVTGVTIDTRTIKEGDLFVPFRGERSNGHDYVQQAMDVGASAVLWQADEPNPPAHIPLIIVQDTEIALQELARQYRLVHQATFIGITGSNGKTSSKDIVAGLLAPYFKVQKTQGNFNNQLGLPITILNLDEDTEVAVLEMGMSGFGEIAFLSILAQPHIAIITNIGEAHMQDLGSREGIAKAKFEIIKGLLPNGILFYDGDEPLLQALITDAITTKSFGMQTTNDLYATAILATEAGSEFTVGGTMEERVLISVLGEHQVKNALGAMLVAQHIGLTPAQIKQSLAQVTLTDMRMQLVSKGELLFINDAYNAAPTSVRAAIEFMNTTTIRPKKWLVLGDMLELGPNELDYHAELATAIDPARIETVLLFGPRMRALYDVLAQRFSAENLYYAAEDISALATIIEQSATNETLILIKGSRGMKLECLI